MRVGVSTVAFPGVALTALPAAAAAVGAEGIAVNVSDTAALTPATSPREIDEFLDRCGDAQLRISAVYGYAGRRLETPGPARQQDLDLAAWCIDVAARLGAPVVRVFASNARGTDAQIDAFAEAILPVARIAEAAGAKLAFPTHRDLAFDPRSCRRLVAGVGRSRCGIIFTGPNMELDGIDPLSALSQMSDLVEQVELKDWRRVDGKPVAAPIGAGEAQVWPVVRALATSRFDGWVTLHHLRQHDPHLPELDAGVAARLRRIAARGAEGDADVV
jgi:sugar phosphate isomerase/epimerase